MRQGTGRRITALACAALVTLAGVAVEGGYTPQITRAQSTQITGQPVNICGTVTAFVASTSTTAGSITFVENGVTTTLGIPQNLAFGGIGPSIVGTNECLSGIMNATSQLLTAHIQQNVTQSTTVCGAVIFTPPASGLLGVLSIGGVLYPVALGTQFTGTTVTNNVNVCIALTLNGLGQITAGAAQPNNGTTTSFTPVALCGTVTAYTPATSSAAGSITFKVGNGPTTISYTLAAGTATIGTGSITTGQDLCFVGVVGASNTAAATAVFSTDITSSIATCGPLGSYTAASSGSLGIVTIGTSTFSIEYGVVPTGDFVITGSQTCLTGTLNGLGQVVSANFQVVQVTPTSTPTRTPVVTPSVTPTQVPIPPPPALNTPTPTSTPLPTATNTPLPTATATATPIPPSASFLSVSRRYGTVHIGAKQTLTVHAGYAGVQRLVASVYFGSGIRIVFKSHTNASGTWSATFTVPKATISTYSHVAVATFQVWKNHTTAKSFVTFTVVR